MKQKTIYILLVPVIFALGWFTGMFPKDSERGSTSAARVDHNSVSAKESEHGERFALGSVQVLGKDFSIARLGELRPGAEGAFEVTSDAELSGLTAYLWVESKDGKRLSAPSKGTSERGKLHFHVLANADSKPHRIVLRLREGGMDERASLPLSGHGHEHSNSPHHGVLAHLLSKSGQLAGYIELKLHDDKGDLELWIAKNEKMDSPLDLPLDSTISVKFIDHGNKEVALKVRNSERNEDEDGNSNLRNEKTNYFIFPSSPAQDSKWLTGKEFSSIVSITFEHGGNQYISEEFVLVPHTHADGEEH